MKNDSYNNGKALKKTLLALCLALAMSAGACSIVINETDSSESKSSQSSQSIVKRQIDGEPVTPDEQLTDREYTIYLDLKKGITEHEEIIEMSIDAKKDELSRAYSALLIGLDGNMLFVPREFNFNYNTDNGVVLEVVVEYAYSAEEIDRMNSEVRAAADLILSGITPEMSEAEKAYYIHDSIILGCEYVDAENGDNAYGCLVEGRAVCEGYSRAMQYLCSQAGLRCLNVTGYANEEHMWNMIEIDDNWYHVDVTWDDPHYDNPIPDFISYLYLNVTTKDITVDHSIDSDEFTYPEANSTEANYFVNRGLLMESSSVFLSKLPALFADSVKKERGFVCVKFSSQNEYDSACSALFEDNGTVLGEIIVAANTITESSEEYGGRSVSTSGLSYASDDVFSVIRINFSIE